MLHLFLNSFCVALFEFMSEGFCRKMPAYAGVCGGFLCDTAG